LARRKALLLRSTLENLLQGRSLSVTNWTAMTYILPPLNAIGCALCRPGIRSRCIVVVVWSASSEVEVILETEKVR
jgi:hypothetical protein